MGFTGWVQWRPVGSISCSVSVTIFSLQSTAKAVSLECMQIRLWLCLFSWVNHQCWNKLIAFLFPEPFAQIATALSPPRTEICSIVFARFLSLLWFAVEEIIYAYYESAN